MSFTAPVSFLVGLPVGLFVGARVQADEPLTGLVMAAGIGAIVVTVLNRADEPSRAAKPGSSVTDLPPDSLFNISSRSAYNRTLLKRRATRILLGGAVGITLGALLDFLLLPYT
jgi:hypothetical protein